MIDILLLGEIFWMWLWVKSKTAERAFLYVGAMFTALFVSTHISPWFAHRFMRTGSTFEWLQDKMDFATHPVGVAGYVVPPAPVGVGFYNQSQWVALHVLQGLFTVLMTWAIFMLFMIIEYLMQVFTDNQGEVHHPREKFLSHTAGFICGFILAGSTVWFLANISWVSFGVRLSTAMDSSVLYHFASQVVEFLTMKVAMLS